MQNEITTLPEDQMRFLVTVNQRFIIGNILYDTKKRTWAFKYSESFESERFLPIQGLPDIGKVYDHQETIEWLSSRMYDKSEVDPFKFRIKESVKNKQNKFVAYFLEVSHVH